MQIDYDDDLGECIEKVNDELASYGLRFVDDEKEHDGFCLYSLMEIEVKTAVLGGYDINVLA